MVRAYAGIPSATLEALGAEVIALAVGAQMATNINDGVGSTTPRSCRQQSLSTAGPGYRPRRRPTVARQLTTRAFGRRRPDYGYPCCCRSARRRRKGHPLS